MYQQKKEKRMLHAKLSKLLVGGAILLAVGPTYAAGNIEYIDDKGNTKRKYYLLVELIL